MLLGSVLLLWLWLEQALCFELEHVAQPVLVLDSVILEIVIKLA